MLQSIARSENQNDDGTRLLFVDDVAGFAEIEAEWKSLETGSPEPCFFQSYAWCGHVAEMQLRAGAGGYTPLVAVLMRYGEVRAIWPLSRRRIGGMWVLSNLDDPFGQFAGLLAADQDAADTLVRRALDEVRRRKLAHAARFERVIHSGLLHTALVQAEAAEGENTGAPIARLVGFGDWEAFFQSKKKKVRSNLRNARRRLDEAGANFQRTVRSDDSLNALIGTALANREAWLSNEGLTSPAFRSPCHEGILLEGDRWGLHEQKIGFELCLNDESVAQQCGFIHNRRYYAFMSGADNPSPGLSPGRIHLAGIIEQLFAEDVDVVELLTPASRYKLEWATDTRALVNMSKSLSLLGWARTTLSDNGLRPFLKRAFYRLPMRARRRILLLIR